MGKQLNSIDILSELEAEATAPAQPEAPKKPAKPKTEKPDLGIQELKKRAEEAGRGKPSPYQSNLREKLRDQVQLNYGKIPKFIAEGMEARAEEEGMNKREYFYHLLRKDGVDIPPYEEMDGRKL